MVRVLVSGRFRGNAWRWLRVLFGGSWGSFSDFCFRLVWLNFAEDFCSFPMLCSWLGFMKFGIWGFWNLVLTIGVFFDIWVYELGFMNLLCRLRDLGVRVLILLMNVKPFSITAIDETKILLISLHDLLTCPFCLPVTKWALYDPSESRFASIHLSSKNTNTIFYLWALETRFLSQ